MYQKRKISLLIIVILCFSASTHAHIIPTNSYQEVVAQLQAADSNTLILFDVDETLIVPTDVLLRTHTRQKPVPWLAEIIDNAFAKAAHPHHYYWDCSHQGTEPFMLIEPIIVDIIGNLQRRNIPVYALTLATSGSASRFIPFYPEYRFNTLHHLGIDFSNTDIADTTFTQLRTYNKAHPMLYKGILFANFTNKGDVLGAFLDYIQWQPDKVIFFDDSLKRIAEVMHECNKRNIPCLCYHYKGADLLAGDLNKEVIEYQLQHLVEHEQWLSDAQAQLLLS